MSACWPVWIQRVSAQPSFDNAWYTGASLMISGRVPLTMAMTGWRQDRVTQDQKEALRAMGVEENVVAMLDTAGQAWTLLELKKRELAKL